MGRKATFYLLGTLFILFTVAALGAAIACRHVPDAPLSSVWLLAGLAAPFVFVLNAVLLIWWLVCRRWIVALIPLVALVVGWRDITAFVQLPHMGEPAAYDLRVASLNVHGFQQSSSRSFSAHRIAGMLREEQVDVACLQEVLDDASNPFDSLANSFKGCMPYFVRELSMACFSRYPILDYEYVRFPESNQSYLRADVQVGDRTVRFISVHLQTSGLSMARRHFRRDYGMEIPLDTLRDVLVKNTLTRMSQVRAVRRVIEESPMPVVVLGDFNDTPVSQTYHLLSRDLTDAFRVAGHGWAGTYGVLLRIDYILYNDYFDAGNYSVWRGEDLSDHSPVIADLRFVR